MSKVIFLDVDGTLIGYDLLVPETAKRAIEETRKKGNKVFLCTGCSKGEVDDRNLNVEIDGMIGANGGYIEVNNKVIFHKPLKKEDLDHFKKWCYSRDLPFHYETNDGIFYSDNNYEIRVARALYKYAHGMDAVLPDDKDLKLDSAFKGIDVNRTDVNKADFLLSSYNDLLDAKKEFSHLVVTSWGGKGENALFGDLVEKDISKGNAIEYLLNYLNIDKKDSFGFGDSKGDLPMFKAVNTSIAMGNGGIEAKENATYVTDSVEDNGLYNAFKHFELI